MTRTLSATGAAALLLLANVAQAGERCSIQVGDVRYPHSVCTVIDQLGMNVSNVAPQAQSKYTVKLELTSAGTANVSWKGLNSQAPQPLGVLRLVGDCWVNGSTRVCLGK